VWREIMDFLHEDEPPRGRGAPAGLVRQAVEYAGGIEPPREEWFIAGTESAQIVAVDTAPGRPRIVSPANGALLAIDPDIPPARQRVLVRIAGAQPGTRLVIGTTPHPAAEPLLWRPTPGRHLLRLVDEKGAEFDRVSVTVRGVSLPRTAYVQGARGPAAQ
jgi:penicillin-binding protein 1C